MSNKIAQQLRTEAATIRSARSAGNALTSGGLQTRSVGSYVPRLTRKAFEKYGFSAAALLTDWAAIVGSDTARYTEPVRLRWSKQPGIWHDTEAVEAGRPGATLMLRVAGGRALDVQYRAGQIIDRINAYFGYRAVAELRIIQATDSATILRAAPKQVLRTASSSARRPTPPELSCIADAPLRMALERMAHAIVMRKTA